MILRFINIECHETDDTFGADSLYAKAGTQEYQLGEFSAGQSRNYSEEILLPVGARNLHIYEYDTFDSDEELGTIDLLEEINKDRVINIVQGTANYDIKIHVTEM